MTPWRSPPGASWRCIDAVVAGCLGLTAAPLVAASETGPVCTDRPTRANAVCTVPTGRVQVEADALSYTRDTAGGVTSETLAAAAAAVKLGLDARSDVELGWTAWQESKTDTGTRRARTKGIGDLVLRYKRRLTSSDAAIGVSAIPYVKLPSASAGIGNERVEGGLILPVSLGLPGGLGLTPGPEIDFLAEVDGNGTRVNITNLVNLSRSFGRLTLYAEYWTANDFAAEIDGDQSSADVAASWLFTPDFRVDAGANFGLDEQSPDYQVYLGVAKRF